MENSELLIFILKARTTFIREKGYEPDACIIHPLYYDILNKNDSDIIRVAGMTLKKSLYLCIDDLILFKDIVFNYPTIFEINEK